MPRAHNLSAVSDNLLPGIRARLFSRVSRASQINVVDIREAEAVYELAQSICAEKIGSGWSATFDSPRAVILPPALHYSDELQQTEFRACLAQGEKGARTIIPVLTNVTRHAFSKIRDSGEQIVLSRHFMVRSDRDKDVYQLVIMPESNLDVMPLRPT